MSYLDRIHNHCQRLLDTLIRKNHDYGNSVFKSPILEPDMPPDEAILVRMSDKLARLANLKNKEAKNESYEDTILDLAGYCILLLAYYGDTDDRNSENN